MKKGKEKSENKLDKLMQLKGKVTRKNFFVGLGVTLLVVQYVQIQSLLGGFSFLEDRDSSLLKEVGEMREAYLNVGKDLNEVRGFLRLSPGNYGLDAEDLEEDGDGKNTNELQVALFKYVDFLGTQAKVEEKVQEGREYFEVFKDENFKKSLVASGMSVGGFTDNEDGIAVNLVSATQQTLVSYYLDKTNGDILVRTVEEKKELKADDKEEFKNDVLSFSKNNGADLERKVLDYTQRKNNLAKFLVSENTKKSLEELGLRVSDKPSEKAFDLNYQIFNKGEKMVGEIKVEANKKNYTLVNSLDQDGKLEITDLEKSFVPFLKKLDSLSVIEKKVAEAKKVIEDTIQDKGFQLLLKDTGVKFSSTPREEDSRYYYDIFFGNTNIKVSSIVIEKATGVVNIVRPDGTNSENILFFDPEFKKKTLEIPENIPDYTGVGLDDDGFNILIAGKNGSLVDTMIFAHFNEQNQTIRMISVPRDLFYKSRKINAYASMYGMEELSKVLSQITGYQLDKYILVDMYAFIEVIDLLGGVDVSLENAVIDPTYRVVDNGKEGTLHYEPGDYHLSGVQALRLARTRHTSSDFARAERQQMILESLQSKAQNFGFGDTDTLYEIAKTVLKKTETNVSLDEALAYYFRYQNFKIESNNVMSSGNILYVPPYTTKENCQKFIEEAEAKGEPRPNCENENDAYTLAPRDNNWNLIKWFFRENFEA